MFWCHIVGAIHLVHFAPALTAFQSFFKRDYGKVIMPLCKFVLYFPSGYTSKQRRISSLLLSSYMNMSDELLRIIRPSYMNMSDELPRIIRPSCMNMSDELPRIILLVSVSVLKL